MVWKILNDGACWIAEFCGNPGEMEIGIVEIATLKNVELIDGSESTLIPETKIKSQPISFRMTANHDPDDILADRTTIREQILAGRKVIIETHTNEQITGRFTKISKIYKLLGNPQKYEIEVEFKPD